MKGQSSEKLACEDRKSKNTQTNFGWVSSCLLLNRSQGSEPAIAKITSQDDCQLEAVWVFYAALMGNQLCRKQVPGKLQYAKLLGYVGWVYFSQGQDQPAWLGHQ